MGEYRFTVGASDPRRILAETDDAAITEAATQVRNLYAADLKDNPQKVVALTGATGLLTRPSERLDEFVERVTGNNPAVDPDTFQPGDTNTPDCNLD